MEGRGLLFFPWEVFMSEQAHYTFFQNRQCEYFPCHKGAAEEDFNCLFCYCPLYCLGQKCGGSFFYDAKGRKVCRDCVFPHLKANYEKVSSRYQEIMAVVQAQDMNCDR